VSNLVHGYVYVSDATPEAMSAARVGCRIALPERRPPYIVVQSRIEQMTVARWPGRLWRVTVVDAVTDVDERANGLTRPLPSAGYVRAIVVEVIEEIPTWKLFGDFGRAVREVIAVASSLDRSLVSLLGQYRHPVADAAYSRAWNAWLAQSKRPLGSDDLTGTLEFSGRVCGSPINNGLSVVFNAVWNRAEAVDGDSAFVHEDEETYLEPAWSTAANALLEAAMAFAAPGVSDASDREIMAAAWRKAIGPSPVDALI
jgi:hypothetical protein